MSTIGHNSGNVGGIAGDRLRSFIQRIERLEEDKKDIQTDIKAVLDEAKSEGWDVPTIKEIIKLRKMDMDKRQERSALLELYMGALGMLADTPLGRAAIEREEKAKAPQTDIEDAIKAANDHGEASAEPVGPFFSAVEGEQVKDGTGAYVSPWMLLHGEVEVFSDGIAAGDVVSAMADALNTRAQHLGRDLTPFEVRDAVLAISEAAGVGPFLVAPYTTEAIQNSAAPATEEKARRGRLSAVETVQFYHLGYDGGEAGKSITEVCEGHTEGAKKHIQRGWADQKDGKARAWERPGATPKPANDDDEPRESSGNVAA